MSEVKKQIDDLSREEQLEFSLRYLGQLYENSWLKLVAASSITDNMSWLSEEDSRIVNRILRDMQDAKETVGENFRV